MPKTRQRLGLDFFLFFEKALYEGKASSQHLSFNIHILVVVNLEITRMKIQNIDPEICSTWIFNLSATFCSSFFKKNIYHVILY